MFVNADGKVFYRERNKTVTLVTNVTLYSTQ